MKPDAEARFEVARDHHGRLGVQDGAARKASFHGIKHHLRVEARARGQHQRFAHGRDVASHHDLIGQLGHIAGAHRTGQGHARPHLLQNRQDLFEDLRFAAGHDGERPIDGFRLTAAHRRIQKLHLFFGASRGHLLRNHGADRTHVHHDGTLARALEHAASA